MHSRDGARRRAALGSFRSLKSRLQSCCESPAQSVDIDCCVHGVAVGDGPSGQFQKREVLKLAGLQRLGGKS